MLLGAATIGGLLWASPVLAYTIGSGFTESCHERMSVAPLSLYLDAQRSADIPLPDDDVWRASASDMERLLKDAGAPLPSSDEKLFAAFSVLSGLRFPDTNGYSLSDINAVRLIHGDLSAVKQYEHALRGAEDEDPTGDLAAIDGTRAVITGYVAEMDRQLGLSKEEQLQKSFVFLDHYGRVEIDVWGPAWLVGKALHAIQDSHSHSIRTEDGAYILHVLNFVDAYSAHLGEGSGMAHSTGMDDCERKEVESLVALATARSLAFVVATEKLRAGDRGQAISAGLSPCEIGRLGEPECGWFSYYPECEERVLAGLELEDTCCSKETGFCSSPYLTTVRSTPTEPYVAGALGCSFSRPEKSRTASLGVPLFVLLMLLLSVRSKSRHRRQKQALLASLFAVAPEAAKADEGRAAASVVDTGQDQGLVFRLEGHGALLSERTGAGLLDVSFGPSLLSGYRFPSSRSFSFGVFGVVEQDSWMAMEVKGRVDPGALQVGAGVEVLYWDYFRSALSAGPSLLLFDTGLHDAGRLGIFWELRPVGLMRAVHPNWALSFDPLSVAWINPTLEGGNSPSTGHLQYRCTLGLEWRPSRREATISQ